MFLQWITLFSVLVFGHYEACTLHTNQNLHKKSLKLWKSGNDIFILWNWPKTSSFRLRYQHHSSAANCARELFKGSNGSASLVNCTLKKFFGWGLRIFCEWRHKWRSFWAILAHVAWPRAQLLGQSISLKFSLETRLESESFEPWSTFYSFWFKSYDFKKNKSIIYLIS